MNRTTSSERRNMKKRFGNVRKLNSGRYQVRYTDQYGNRQTARTKAMKQQTWIKEGGCEELKKVLDELEKSSWIDQGSEENQWTASKNRILKYHRS